MKKLTCEMCGSTDLIKDGGVFVCQTCGCKYSIEEAKRMMVEGTVFVANTAQFDNLVKLARDALNSNNAAEAEKQANLALAIKSDDYEVLMIKARAIDGQTTGSGSRFDEAYNCYLNAWESLPEEEKVNYVADFCREVNNALKSEVRFWVNQVERQRPTKANAKRAIDTYFDLSFRQIELRAKFNGYEIPEDAEFSDLSNCFVMAVSNMANNAWESTVGYNYYRDSLYNLGAHWKRNGAEDVTTQFRPGDNIFDTFCTEIDNLVYIMSVATGIVCNDPPYDTYAALYSNMAFLTEQKANAVSFNGYTYSSSYSAYSYYQVNYSWKAAAKEEWFGKAREWRAKAKEMERLAAEKKEAERLKRIDAYWEIHADEKAAFDAEKNELSDKITALNDEIARIPEKAELEKLTDDINSLDAEKKALGLFKLKEKKQLQEKIDEIKSQKTAVFAKVDAQERVIQKKIDELRKRINEINKELKKDR